MSDNSSQAEPPGFWNDFRRRFAWILAVPLAIVGALSAVAQLIDYLDGKTRILWVAMAIIAGLAWAALGVAFYRNVGQRFPDIRWPAFVVYGSAAVAALSMLAVVVTPFVPVSGEERARPPASQPPASAASAQPSATSTPPPSPVAPSPPTGPFVEGVSCQTGFPEEVKITSIVAADGGAQVDGDIVVALTVPQPPTGSVYWLMVYADDVPRNLHFVWKKLAPGDVQVRHTITADVGTNRRIYVARSNPENEDWFTTNLARDRDSKWDGNRVELPSGAEMVSNTCDAVRLRE
jgi:hypothetical protein